MIWVEGGSVVNLMAVWRAHGLASIMQDCWDAGVVLAGSSAGSLCWHLGGPTDSFGDSLSPFRDGLEGKRAWYVEPDSNGGYVERALEPRLL